jgi:hypothetical protein
VPNGTVAIPVVEVAEAETATLAVVAAEVVEVVVVAIRLEAVLLGGDILEAVVELAEVVADTRVHLRPSVAEDMLRVSLRTTMNSYLSISYQNPSNRRPPATAPAAASPLANRLNTNANLSQDRPGLLDRRDRREAMDKLDRRANQDLVPVSTKMAMAMKPELVDADSRVAQRAQLGLLVHQVKEYLWEVMYR